jgi:hypothetical protein
MSFRTRRDAAAESAEAVARVTRELEGFLTEAGPDAAVSIRYVLDLLKPPGKGMWSFDPERRKAAQEPPADPHRDKLTGARWAGAPGTEPPPG